MLVSLSDVGWFTDDDLRFCIQYVVDKDGLGR